LAKEDGGPTTTVLIRTLHNCEPKRRQRNVCRCVFQVHNNCKRIRQKACTQYTYVTQKRKEKDSSLHDFGFFGEEECFPRRYVPLVRWRFDSLLGEKPRAASEPLHIPASSSPFAPNKWFVRLLRLPEFRLRISHTSKKEQLTGAMKERKNAKNLVQSERRHANKVADSRHHMRAILSNCPLVNTTVPQPCSLSLSLFVYLLT
jgi:hypothetical protein